MTPSTLAFLILLASLFISPIDSSPPPSLPRTTLVQHAAAQEDTGGLSFEQCVAETSECRFPRFCRSVSSPDSACTQGECYCLPDSPRQCSSHSHCVEGEVCAEIQGFGTLCAAESFVSDIPDAQKLPGEKIPPPPFPSDEGLTFDPCEGDSCAIPRFCRSLPDPELPCRADNSCQCLPNRMIFCSSSKECVLGEVCASVPDVGVVCASESFVRHISSSDSSDKPEVIEVSPDPTPPASSSSASGDGEQSEETDSESLFGSICISVEFLDHLPRSALRFETDNLASVLCDENGSCATPGHIVQYHGEPMMMNSYCQRAKCTRKVMRVNSPWYKQRMVIPSHTSGLMFTVLAARYGTFTEEMVLKAAVRIGF